MNLENYFKVLAETPEEVTREVKLSMQILDRINELIQLKFGGKQKDLANALGVSEAAVSKMVNGVQNFNIRTISKLEKVFNSPILAVCSEEEDESEYIPVKPVPIISTKIHINESGSIIQDEFLMTNSVSIRYEHE